MHITPMHESHVSECAGDSDYHSIYQLIIKPTLNAISELRYKIVESGASGRKSGNSLMDGVGIAVQNSRIRNVRQEIGKFTDGRCRK